MREAGANAVTIDKKRIYIVADCAPQRTERGLTMHERSVSIKHEALRTLGEILEVTPRATAHVDQRGFRHRDLKALEEEVRREGLAVARDPSEMLFGDPYSIDTIDAAEPGAAPRFIVTTVSGVTFEGQSTKGFATRSAAESRTRTRPDSTAPADIDQARRESPLADVWQRETGAITPPFNVKDDVDATGVGAQNGTDGQPDISAKAARNIGLLDRAIARHLGRAGAGTEVHPYVGRRLPEDEGLRAVAAAFGGRLQGFGLNADLLADDRERYGFFNGVRTGVVVFVADKATRLHRGVLGHQMGHELRARRPDFKRTFDFSAADGDVRQAARREG